LSVHAGKSLTTHHVTSSEAVVLPSGLAVIGVVRLTRLRTTWLELPLDPTYKSWRFVGRVEPRNLRADEVMAWSARPFTARPDDSTGFFLLAPLQPLPGVSGFNPDFDTGNPGKCSLCTIG
jgi:hypothetical protein